MIAPQYWERDPSAAGRFPAQVVCDVESFSGPWRTHAYYVIIANSVSVAGIGKVEQN